MTAFAGSLAFLTEIENVKLEGSGGRREIFAYANGQKAWISGGPTANAEAMVDAIRSLPNKYGSDGYFDFPKYQFIQSPVNANVTEMIGIRVGNVSIAKGDAKGLNTVSAGNNQHSLLALTQGEPVVLITDSPHAVSLVRQAIIQAQLSYGGSDGYYSVDLHTFIPSNPLGIEF